MLDLSVIVIHWNVPDLLDACLTSVRSELAGMQQTHETIVIDNDSDSPALRAVLASHNEIEARFETVNRGYAAGCNVGIQAARGEFALLLNPDIVLRSGCLQSLWTTMHAGSHIGMVAPLLLNEDGSTQSSGYRFPGVMNVLLDLYPVHPRLVESRLNGRYPPSDGASPYRVDYPLGAAMLVRRAAWEDVGLLDESYGMYCEEIDWAKRFAQRGWTILVAPAARAIHLAGQSTTQRREEMRTVLWGSRVRYFRRWGDRRQREILARLVPTSAKTGRHAGDHNTVEQFRQLRGGTHG